MLCYYVCDCPVLPSLPATASNQLQQLSSFAVFRGCSVDERVTVLSCRAPQLQQMACCWRAHAAVECALRHAY
jgi:hypothetical protein